MKEDNPFMAHQSDDQIIASHHPLDSNNLHSSQDVNMEQGQGQEGPFLLSTPIHDDSDKDVAQNPCASKPHVCNKEETALQELVSDVAKESDVDEDSGRERLKKHRVEVAGRVWIPEIWGQEELLKDWIDCTAFDATLVPSRITTARAALVEEDRRANAAGLRIENRC